MRTIIYDKHSHLYHLLFNHIEVFVFGWVVKKGGHLWGNFRPKKEIVICLVEFLMLVYTHTTGIFTYINVY